MASQPRNSAREERRLEIRRLAIASVSSAAAAVIVSQFWVSGTWLAAALTPVFVILIQEALHKPADVLADRFTSGRTAVLPEGTGAGPPPPAAATRSRRAEGGVHEPPTRAPAEPGSGPEGAQPPVRVYRTGAGGGPGRPRSAKRKLAIGTVAVTAFLAFAIAAFAITGAELITGGSIGKSDKHTTLFGGNRNTSTTESQDTNTTGQQQPQQGQQQQKTTSDQNQQDGQQTTPTQPGGSGGTPTAPVPQTTTP
jgi:hypothetical protein